MGWGKVWRASENDTQKPGVREIEKNLFWELECGVWKWVDGW